MQILPQAIPEVLLLVPQVHGDARGFFVESEYYHPQSEQGIAWNDPALGISWPALVENTAIQLSAKDQGNPRLAEQALNCLPG